MAWQKITSEDLASRLSADEIAAYSANGAWDRDAAAQLLAQTTAVFRGHVASGRKCRMDADAETLPAMLVSAALAYATFDLCARLGTEPTEARKEARRAAEELLVKIAAGEIVPEDAGDAPTAAPSLAQCPAFAQATPERMLD